MESFRTEIENPIVQKDIIDLERKIALFRDGKIDDERSVAFVWREEFTVSVRKAYK